MRPSAVLASKAVPQEHVEPRESGMPRRVDVFLQRDDTGQPHLEGGAAHNGIVMVDDVDAVEKHRLDRVLPRPERQWEIAERTEIRVQHQGRAAIEQGRHRKTYCSSRPMLALTREYDDLIADRTTGDKF